MEVELLSMKRYFSFNIALRKKKKKKKKRKKKKKLELVQKMKSLPKGGLEPPFPRPQRGVLTPIRLELICWSIAGLVLARTSILHVDQLTSTVTGRLPWTDRL